MLDVMCNRVVVRVRSGARSLDLSHGLQAAISLGFFSLVSGIILKTNDGWAACFRGGQPPATMDGRGSASPFETRPLPGAHLRVRPGLRAV
ncbi:MAG: hypothetical protein Tsb0032_09580 [Kiloniellaceae bacterium]